MEGNWGYAGAKVISISTCASTAINSRLFHPHDFISVIAQATDTADQDADKARTYDYCRVEYAHMDAILYIGTTVICFCF